MVLHSVGMNWWRVFQLSNHLDSFTIQTHFIKELLNSYNCEEPFGSAQDELCDAAIQNAGNYAKLRLDCHTPMTFAMTKGASGQQYSKATATNPKSRHRESPKAMRRSSSAQLICEP